LTSLTSLSEDIEPAPGVRRAVEVVDCLAGGARLALGPAAFFGNAASETEARGRDVAADLADVVESGETRDARCGAAGLAAAAEEAVAEDNLPDVEVANVDDRAGGPAGFAGANDDLRVGAGTEGAVDCLGGMVALEEGREVASGDFFVGGWDAALEIGGGTAFVTPVPNLPEFSICNAQRVRKRRLERASTSRIKEVRILPSLPVGSEAQQRL
jgi:hypothetical protein